MTDRLNHFANIHTMDDDFAALTIVLRNYRGWCYFQRTDGERSMLQLESSPNQLRRYFTLPILLDDDLARGTDVMLIAYSHGDSWRLRLARLGPRPDGFDDIEILTSITWPDMRDLPSADDLQQSAAVFGAPLQGTTQTHVERRASSKRMPLMQCFRALAVQVALVSHGCGAPGVRALLDDRFWERAVESFPAEFKVESC